MFSVALRLDYVWDPKKVPINPDLPVVLIQYVMLIFLVKDMSHSAFYKGTCTFLNVEDSLADFAVDTQQQFPYLSARKVGVHIRIDT
jgi:hypothetical protein